MATGSGLLLDENVAAGLPTTKKFLEGVSNIDPALPIEKGFLLPYVIDAGASWLDCRCTVMIELDPGIAVHKILPQSPSSIDTLASAVMTKTGRIPVIAQGASLSPGGTVTPISVADFAAPGTWQTAVGQANTISAGKYQDFVQRMATSKYRFCLKGWAIRAGHRIPIPGLVSWAGVTAIPDWPQRVLSDSEIVANYSGVPIFFAQWELWYIVNVPPTALQTPPPNVAEHITADATLPTGMQVPVSPLDSLAVQAAPTSPTQTTNQKFLRQQ